MVNKASHGLMVSQASHGLPVYGLGQPTMKAISGLVQVLKDAGHQVRSTPLALAYTDLQSIMRFSDGYFTCRS